MQFLLRNNRTASIRAEILLNSFRDATSRADVDLSHGGRAREASFALPEITHRVSGAVHVHHLVYHVRLPALLN